MHLMNDTGDGLALRRLPEGLGVIGGLHELIVEHAKEPMWWLVSKPTEACGWTP
jgi:hypothetical protein